METRSGDPLSSTKSFASEGKGSRLKAVPRGEGTTESPIATKGPGGVVGIVSAADPRTGYSG